MTGLLVPRLGEIEVDLQVGGASYFIPSNLLSLLFFSHGRLRWVIKKKEQLARSQRFENANFIGVEVRCCCRRGRSRFLNYFSESTSIPNCAWSSESVVKVQLKGIEVYQVL